MSKKDISKLLTTGSIKQKLLLLAEDIARGKVGQERILTSQEFHAISDSIKKPNEIRLYNKFRRADETVTNALVNLQGLTFEVKMHYSNLRGYILVWNTIENAELLVNSVLHETKDLEERRRIAKAGAKGVDLLFSKIIPDDEGYIEIEIDFERDTYRDENGKLLDFKEKPRKTKEMTLWTVMNNVKQEATTTAIRFLSWRQAILDYMDEQGFNIKTYKDQIKMLTDQVYTPVIGWEKYQSEEESFFRTSPDKRLDNLKSKYAITPNVAEMEVDPEIYNWFKEKFLENE